jgi:hypothetical protein
MLAQRLFLATVVMPVSLDRELDEETWKVLICQGIKRRTKRQKRLSNVLHRAVAFSHMC